jgi:ubiquinone/menaquinone biosynthesis C-methylase UbiE
VDTKTPVPGFVDFDRNEDPEFFLSVLDRRTIVWREVRRQTYALLDVHEGDQLLDVGCGPGDAVRELAQRVGSTGHVIGVDKSETMIQEARRRAQGATLPSEYRLGDVYQLEFADNTFDGCRAERVFMHLDDPLRALSEIRRVTRPDGHIVIAEPDSEMRVVDVPDRELTRRIFHYAFDKVTNGWIGRQLPRLMKQAGLVNISILPQTLIVTDLAEGLGGMDTQLFERRLEQARADGAVSGAEAVRWWQQLREANQAGCYFSASTSFIVSGRKP